MWSQVWQRCLMSIARHVQALAAFPTAFGGPPDVIVLGVNLWDLARWKVRALFPLLCTACTTLALRCI